jgi:hypothetical protein
MIVRILWWFLRTFIHLEPKFDAQGEAANVKMRLVSFFNVQLNSPLFQ